MKKPTVKAILIPYCEEQNEPSRPLPKVFDLPGTIKPREKVLKDLFIKHIMDDIEPKEIKVKAGNGYDYGDIVVSHNSGCHLFVTFIKE